MGVPVMAAREETAHRSDVIQAVKELERASVEYTLSVWDPKATDRMKQHAEALYWKAWREIHETLDDAGVMWR